MARHADPEARGLADAGDYEGARAKLIEAAKELRTRAPGSQRADELFAQARTWEERAELLAPDSWAMDRKRMTYENRAIKERRDRGPRLDPRD